MAATNSQYIFLGTSVPAADNSALVYHNFDGNGPAKRGYVKPEEWEPHKDFILRHRDPASKTPIKEIVRLLRTQRKFITTEQKLRHKLGTWRSSNRNIMSKKKQLYISKVSRERAKEGKRSVFKHGDDQVEIRESIVKRYMNMNETQFPGTLILSPGSITVETPADIEMIDLVDTPGYIEEVEDGDNLALLMRPLEDSDPSIPSTIEIQPPSRSSSGDKNRSSKEVAVDINTASDCSIDLDPASSSSEVDSTTDIEADCEYILQTVNRVDTYLQANSTSENPGPDIEPEELLGWEFRGEFQDSIEGQVEEAELFLKRMEEYRNNFEVSEEDAYKEISLSWRSEYYYTDCALPLKVYRSLSGIRINWSSLSTPPSRSKSILNERDQAEEEEEEEKWSDILRLHSDNYKAISYMYIKSQQSSDLEALSLQVAERYFGRHHFITADCLIAFLSCLLHICEADDRVAQALYYALEIIESFNMKNHEHYWDHLGHLAVRIQNIDKDTANRLTRDLYQSSTRTYGKSHIMTGQFMLECVRDLLDDGASLEEALKILTGKDNTVKNLVDILTKSMVAVSSSPDGNAFAAVVNLGLALFGVLGDLNLHEDRINVSKTLLAFVDRSRSYGTIINFNMTFMYALLPLASSYLGIQDYKKSIETFRIALEYGNKYQGNAISTLFQRGYMPEFTSALEKVGPILYLIPILEKTLDLVQQNGREESEEGFQLWLKYSNASFRLWGLDGEVSQLRRALMPSSEV